MTAKIVALRLRTNLIAATSVSMNGILRQIKFQP
jgi:hypothetical protein